ncbi:MAG: GWxTD domain-containing protein [Candidatus Aminicenantes bacterium]|nr:GWxTD domain-containing protein [Candidatus Aminicenantes bacterium]
MKTLTRCFLISTLAAILLLTGAFPAAAQTKFKIKDLPPTYQEWLKVVSYIIKDKERDVFLSLQVDRDRDLFIEAFWKMRDPTPATPKNEYKEEHMKRFTEANRLFRFGSAREGWMTDRARFYIILGPPVSKIYDAGSNEIYPTEIWSYYGDTAKGMPIHFQLVFFQYRNAGEMKLYDPMTDGPERLLVRSSTEFNIGDYSAMIQKIHDFRPELALVCLSIIPGDIPPGFQPSLDTAFYMAAIYESPKKGLNDSYATHFLNLRGVVSTEYLTNFMNSEATVAVIHDPATGLTTCDFVIVPERLSVDFYDPKREYSTSFAVDVSLRSGDKVVLQYSKEYPLTIPESQMDQTRNMGIAVADSFPVIEGSYKLTVLLRNVVGKEFSVLEHDLVVPQTAGAPRLLGPALGVGLVASRADFHLPFQLVAQKLSVDPKNTYSHADQVAYIFSALGVTQALWAEGRVVTTVKGTSPGSVFQRTYSLPLSGQPYRSSLGLSQSLPASEFPPDYYELTLTLQDAQGSVLDTKTAGFVVSPGKSVAHPVVASRPFPTANSFQAQYMLAYQYDQTGQLDRAEESYRRALALNPAYLPKIPEYAGFLLKTKKHEAALRLIETVKDDANLKFSYFLIKGQALAGLERYNEALLSLQEGNRIYNSDSGLLAVLGNCYYKTGDKERALAALKASLSLDQEQPEVKALIKEIEGKK